MSEWTAQRNANMEKFMLHLQIVHILQFIVHQMIMYMLLINAMYKSILMLYQKAGHVTES